MTPPRNASDAPGTSVSAAATRPPVSDSAAATVSPRRVSSRMISVASSRAAGPATPRKPPSSVSDTRYPSLDDSNCHLLATRPRLDRVVGLFARLLAHPHRAYDVVRSRHQRYHERRGHDNLLDQGGQAERRGQHVQGDRDDLQQRLQLAALARRDDPAPDDREAQRGDADLAEQDQAGYPAGQLTEGRQRDQRGPGKRLVRDRVGDLAEVGHQAALAGQLPVE